MTYSGPTFIAIRSGKHSQSTAATHAYDFKSLLKQPAFDAILKTDKGDIKPIIIFTVDGGPDENPRFVFFIKHKTIVLTMNLFLFQVSEKHSICYTSF